MSPGVKNYHLSMGPCLADARQKFELAFTCHFQLWGVRATLGEGRAELGVVAAVRIESGVGREAGDVVTAEVEE